MKKSAEIINEKQRTEIIDKLLSSKPADQRQRFANCAVAAPCPPLCREVTASNLAACLATVSRSCGMDSHMTYLRRLNGESKNGRFIENTTEKITPVLLPHLHPKNGQNNAVFCALIGNFFSSGRHPQFSDLSQHDVVHFVYYLLDAVFSSEKGEKVDNAAYLTGIAMALNDLNERFQVNVSVVKFNPVAHEYYVRDCKMDLSVTKSLDQIFDFFNENNAADRMIRSRNWTRNRLFNQINYDESGNQRDKETLRCLVKKEWKKRRDCGTRLHDHIHRSYTANAPAGMAIERPGKADGMSSNGSVGRGVEISSCSRANEVKRNISTGKATYSPADDGSVPCSVDSRAELLWKQLRPCFAQNLSSREQTTKENKPAKSRDIDAATNVVPGDNVHANSQHQASLENIDLLDKANVTAFARWNRLRLHDHWLLLAAEYTVYDELAGLAGTIDAIFLPYPHRPDMVVLVDWKRCEIDFGTRYYGPNMRYQHDYTRRYPKCNYWKYAFQLNIYREMLERAHNGCLIVADMMIVNFLPDSEYPRTFSVPRIPEARLFLDDLRARRGNTNVGNLDAILA